jgi:hypothetical protein
VLECPDMTSTGTVTFRGSDQQADVLAQCLREQGLEVTVTLATHTPSDAGDEQTDHGITTTSGANSVPAPRTLKTAARKEAEEFRTRFP